MFGCRKADTMTDEEVMTALGIDAEDLAYMVRIGDIIPEQEKPRAFLRKDIEDYRAKMDQEREAFHDLMVAQKELGLYKYTSDQLEGR